MNSVNNTPEEIWQKIQSLKKVALSLHRSPDGDSIGSATAFKYILEKECQCKVDLVSGDSSDLQIQANQEVDYSRDIADLDLTQYDAFICIDQSDLDRMSSKTKVGFTVPEGTLIINIDHHASNTYFGTLNYVIPTATSACEVLLDLTRQWNVQIDKELATRLLTGITTDTGFFKYVNNSKIFKDVAFLIDQGANYRKEIMEPLIYTQTLANKKFLGLVFSNIQHNTDKGFYYVLISKKQWQDLGLTEDQVSGASSTFSDLSDATFNFALVEKEDGISGSFRSRKYDVSKIAESLGGGGHKPAAGVFFSEISLDQAAQKVLAAIEQVGLQPIE